MYKCLILLLLPCLLIAQESTEVEQSSLQQYVSLEDNKVYDIEIIVFAYQHPLPNYKTYTNTAIVDDTLALELELKPEDLPFSKTIEDIGIETPAESTDETTKYTVSLDEKEDFQHVLSWFNHNEEDFKLIKIWEKLNKQPNIVPLMHRSWRQIETPFEDPTYVKVTNIPNADDDLLTDEHSFSNENTLVDANLMPDEDMINKAIILDDFSLTGMVALSKGRFMHFKNSLNLYRTLKDQEGNIVKNMIFSLEEKKQVKIDELNYFDSPWIGSIVKITEYEEIIEEITDEPNDE
jgi:hypothetical protein